MGRVGRVGRDGEWMACKESDYGFWEWLRIWDPVVDSSPIWLRIFLCSFPVREEFS